MAIKYLIQKLWTLWIRLIFKFMQHIFSLKVPQELTNSITISIWCSNYSPSPKAHFLSSQLLWHFLYEVQKDRVHWNIAQANLTSLSRHKTCSVNINLLNRKILNNWENEQQGLLLCSICLLLGRLKWKSQHDTTSQQCLVSTKNVETKRWQTNHGNSLPSNQEGFHAQFKSW